MYSGIKAAVANFGKTLALELAADGIRVNAIAADHTPTEGMAALTPAESHSDAESRALECESAPRPLRASSRF